MTTNEAFDRNGSYATVAVTQSPEAAATLADKLFPSVDGSVFVERGSWEEALEVTRHLRALPDPKPVRLSAMNETPEEWIAAVREQPRCIHVFVERRCVVCHAAAMGGCFSDGVQEWPVCVGHRDSLAESLGMEAGR